MITDAALQFCEARVFTTDGCSLLQVNTHHVDF